MKPISFLTRIRSTLTLAASVFVGLSASQLPAQDKDKPAAPAKAADAAPATPADASSDAAETAWKDVLKATRPPMPPAEWQSQRPTREQVETFQKEQAELSIKAADAAKDFYVRFPSNAKAAEAGRKEMEMLQFAVRLGNTNTVARLEALEAARLKDPKLSEDERFKLRMAAVQRTMMLKQPETQEEASEMQEKAGRELIKEFPKKEAGYQFLLSAAGGSDEAKSRAIAKEVLAANPPEQAKISAEGILRKLEAVGKPLPIKFAAVDGRNVDVTALKGKVVLVDFWATWCGPCVAELPNVKAAYDKLHPKGLEIVGISFDSDRKKLENFVAENKMEWPQYFDGKQWENKFGREYGINSIPAMWLVDKKGNLRDMQGRDDLERKVEKLLAE